MLQFNNNNNNNIHCNNNLIFFIIEFYEMQLICGYFKTKTPVITIKVFLKTCLLK